MDWAINLRIVLYQLNTTQLKFCRILGPTIKKRPVEIFFLFLWKPGQPTQKMVPVSCKIDLIQPIILYYGGWAINPLEFGPTHPNA